MALALGLAVGRGPLEAAIRARLLSEGAKRGLSVAIDAVRLGPWPPLRLDGVRIRKSGGLSVHADTIGVTLRPWGRGLRGRLRLTLGRVSVSGPGGLSIECEPAVWDVVARSGGIGLDLRAPSRGLSLAWLRQPDGDRIEVSADGADLESLFSLERGRVPLVHLGVASGTLGLALGERSTALDVALRSHGMRFPALSGDASLFDAPAFGQPTDVDLALAGAWRPAEGVLDMPRWRARVSGATLSGSLSVTGVPGDPQVDLSLDVERVDFAHVFRTSGLDQPGAVTVGTASTASDLGSASLSARVTGRLADPTSFVVAQKLDFTPPRQLPAVLLRLRNDFSYEVTPSGGGRRQIVVSPTSADFIAIGDVPPLFLRTLLIAEDAGFYGHRGIDLTELPSAVLTNLSQGGAARGASTITQQLAKNLFLGREKNLGRKLQELSLALLIEATISKSRILEIYLNVIEWGPGLYGLRPASHRYFHREPSELTPAQTAFLVALIPGPVKYQRSFADGTPSPGFRQLVDRLLVKLRSVDALTEEQYEAARAEDLQIDSSTYETETPSEEVPSPTGSSSAGPGL
jgi:hypothetical protein